MRTKIVGDALEVFVEGYLATQQKMQAEAVWLVGQIPLDIRLKLNLPNDAKGAWQSIGLTAAAKFRAVRGISRLLEKSRQVTPPTTEPKRGICG